MKIEMTFNDDAIIENGYERNDIYTTLKNAFWEFGIPCSSETETLSFCDTGNENDYAHMWILLIDLLKMDWFIACASSCMFFDDDDTEEDVLSQAWKVRQRMA